MYLTHKVFKGKKQIEDPIKINESLVEEKFVEEQVIEEIQKVETKTTVEKPPVQEKKKSSTEDKKTDENVTTPREDNKTVEIVVPPSDPIVEEKEEVIDDTIVDTSDIFYSIHLGRVDTTTLAECLSLGEKLAFKYVEDIIYHNCIEVTSTTNKSLGYYLDLICNSGECEKYKN